MTLVKNDLPWTLHPLPPPLPTAKTIRLEVDKSMPWALHPLPPPVKTKSYSDYYWPEPKTQPKYYRHRFKPPKTRQNHFTDNRHKPVVVHSGPPPPAADFKPSNHPSKPAPEEYDDGDHHHHHDPQPDDHRDDGTVEHKPDYKQPADHHYEDDGFKPVVDYKHVEYTPVDFKQIEYKHVDYKHVDYKSPDYKSPDYKTDYPKSNDEERGDEHQQHVYHHPYHGSPHDDHASPELPSSSPSSQSAPAEYVSHITIEPSIQIAAFSETEMQGDGTSPQGDAKHNKCQCTINGHRHKRHAQPGGWTAAAAAAVANSTGSANNATTAVRDSDVARSSSWSSYVTPKAGHASEVQILKSHDITDQSMINTPVGYVQQVRGGMDAREANREEARKNPQVDFRDESDKFKVDFGRDGFKSADGKGRSSQSNDGDNGDGGEGKRSGFNSDEYKSRLTRKPNQGRGIHITKSKVENTDRGVAFSVQTPFSVSSFSSNIRHPLTDERQSRFRFSELQTTSSPFQSEYPEPLNFEHFGLKSVLIDDEPPNNAGRLTTHFSRGFNDKPPETIGRLSSHYTGGFGTDKPSDFSSQLASHFSRDFGSDDDRSRLKTSKPFRYHTKHGSSTSDLFNSPLRGGRPSSDDSVLEYFQPIVIDFDSLSKDKEENNFKSFGNGNGGSDKSRYFGKSESTAGISKFKKNQNFDPLRLPGRLHESNENLSRKMIFHPSMFDID